VDFDTGHVGVRGSPTIVYRMGTPPLPEAGEKVSTRDIGMEAVLDFTFNKAEETGVLNTMLGGKQ
jgi:hypothetical protein